MLQSMIASMFGISPDEMKKYADDALKLINDTRAQLQRIEAKQDEILRRMEGNGNGTIAEQRNVIDQRPNGANGH